MVVLFRKSLTGGFRRWHCRKGLSAYGPLLSVTVSAATRPDHRVYYQIGLNYKKQKRAVKHQLTKPSASVDFLGKEG